MTDSTPVTALRASWWAPFHAAASALNPRDMEWRHHPAAVHSKRETRRDLATMQTISEAVN